MGVKIGNSALLRDAVDRKRTPQRRAPAKISDIDGARAAAKSQSQTLEVARYGVRRIAEAQDVEAAEWNSACAKSRTPGGVPWGELQTEPKRAGRPYGEPVRIRSLVRGFRMAICRPPSEGASTCHSVFFGAGPLFAIHIDTDPQTSFALRPELRTLSGPLGGPDTL